MSKGEKRRGAALAPNVLWAQRNEGETVELAYDDATYRVTVERVDGGDGA